MKKVVRIIILFLVVITALILIAFSMKHNNYIFIEEMSNLSKSIYDYKNIHIYEIETSNEMLSHRVHDTYIKDDKEFVKSSGYNVGSIGYTDREIKEVITIVDAEQNIYISSYSNDIDDKYYTVNPLLRKEDDAIYTYLKERYKYKGIEIINSKECYCFEINDPVCIQTYWIYKDTGLLAKFEQIADKPGTDEKQIQTSIDLYEFDTVTDDDVKRPNIQEYEDIGYELIDNRKNKE